MKCLDLAFSLMARGGATIATKGMSSPFKIAWTGVHTNNLKIYTGKHSC